MLKIIPVTLFFLNVFCVCAVLYLSDAPVGAYFNLAVSLMLAYALNKD